MRETITAVILSGNAVFLLLMLYGIGKRSLFKRDVGNILNNGSTTPELDDAARALHDVAHDHGVEIVAVVFNIETGARAAVAFGIASCPSNSSQRADMLTVAANQLAQTSAQLRFQGGK